MAYRTPSNDRCIFSKHHQADYGEAYFEFCGWYLDMPLGVVPIEEQDILSKANLKVGTGKTFVPLSKEDQVRVDATASQASKLNVVLESPLVDVKKRSRPQGKKTSDKSKDKKKKEKVIQDLSDDENDFATIGLNPLKSQTTTIHLDTMSGNPKAVCPLKLKLQFGTYAIPGERLSLT